MRASPYWVSVLHVTRLDFLPFWALFMAIIFQHTPYKVVIMLFALMLSYTACIALANHLLSSLFTRFSLTISPVLRKAPIPSIKAEAIHANHTPDKKGTL